MQKVAVIGCPGSGKTTFSLRLAAHTRLSLYHLDSFYFQKDKDYQNNKPAWRAEVQRLVLGDEWIIDGNYISTMNVRLSAADTIIYLNFPTYLCLWRAFKRRWQYRHKRRPDMPEGWKEKISLDFLLFIISFRFIMRPRIAMMLRNHKDKNVIIFRKPKELDHFLTGIEAER